MVNAILYQARNRLPLAVPGANEQCTARVGPPVGDDQARRSLRLRIVK
jgi:hypothetical protein